MAQSEVTGATPHELAEMRVEHRSSPLYENHGVPFEVAYCLTEIGKQPDEYDGPTRHCQRRASKRDDYDGHRFDEAAYAPSCPFHGGDFSDNISDEDRPDPLTVAIQHGVYAEDEHLRMDFNDAEQTLYDSIVETWPEVYGWPSEDEDPARYLMLRKVATNVVRSERAEDYLDEEGEVHFAEVFDEDGVVVGEEPEENALSREYRLLVDEIISMLKELGLTPKERQKMDTMEAEERQHDVVADVAQQALADGDKDYDPTEFEED